jgi:hypothetical protein
MAAVRKLIREARIPKEKGQPLSQDGWPNWLSFPIRIKVHGTDIVQLDSACSAR